jgi:3-dehydroquinate dehydratase
MPKILVLHAAKSGEIARIITNPAAFAHTSAAPGCAGKTGL